jgi:hypothetical protein
LPKNVSAFEYEVLKCCPIIQASISYVRMFDFLLRSLLSKVRTVSREIACLMFLNQTMSRLLRFKVRQEQGQLYIYCLKLSSQVKAVTLIHHFRVESYSTLGVSKRKLLQ